MYRLLSTLQSPEPLSLQSTKLSRNNQFSVCALLRLLSEVFRAKQPQDESQIFMSEKLQTEMLLIEALSEEDVF